MLDGSLCNKVYKSIKLGSFFKTVSTYTCSLWRTSRCVMMEDWICISLAFILASSTESVANSLWVWSDWEKCFSLWVGLMGSCMLEILRFLSKLNICWLVSYVKNVKSHNFLYNEKIFSTIVLNFSIFLAKSTYVSAISLDIFSFTFPLNFLFDHSMSLAFVSWSSLVTWSTISDSCSIMGFDSSGDYKLKASM